MSRITFVVLCAFLVCASAVLAVDISRTQRRSEMSLEATPCTGATTSTEYSLPNHRYVARCISVHVYILFCFVLLLSGTVTVFVFVCFVSHLTCLSKAPVYVLNYSVSPTPSSYPSCLLSPFLHTHSYLTEVAYDAIKKEKGEDKLPKQDLFAPLEREDSPRFGWISPIRRKVADFVHVTGAKAIVKLGDALDWVTSKKSEATRTNVSCVIYHI
jgi:hypothetical protein